MDIYLSALVNIGGIYTARSPCSTSLLIVHTPWLAKVQTHLHGKKNLKQKRKVCLRRRINGVQDA